MYFAAQILGGIAAAALTKFILNTKAGSNLAVSPVSYLPTPDALPVYRTFAAPFSEAGGTAFFVLLFMICNDKKTQFSNDQVMNCFTMASSYIAARLFGGG